MAKPFKNAPAFQGEVSDFHLLAIQAGTAQDGAGLSQMRHITAAKLREYMLQGFGRAMNFLGTLTQTPLRPVVNDYFLAGSTWDSFVENHLYEFNGSTWSDISGLLDRYATASAMQELESRVSAVEQAIEDLPSGGGSEVPELDITSTKIQMSASLSLGNDNEYSVLTLGLVHDDPAIEQGVDVVSDVSIHTNENS